MSPDYPRLLAGSFAGTGALLFIYMGEFAVAAGILMGMVGFFVGERNGIKNAQNRTGP